MSNGTLQSNGDACEVCTTVCCGQCILSSSAELNWKSDKDMPDIARITVMIAFVNGLQIYSCRSGATNWDKDDYPSWDWLNKDYKIGEQ